MQSHIFRDFDAFAASVRDIDASMMLQNAKQRLWSINQITLDGIDVQLGRLGSGNIVEGESWANGYLFYLPLTDSCAYSANGIVLPPDSFMILEPGCDFCISTKDEHDWCSVFVPEDKLQQCGELTTTTGDEKKNACRVASTNRQIANQFYSNVTQLMSSCATEPQIECGPAATSAAAELIELTVNILGVRRYHEIHPVGRPRVSRPEIIRLSHELLEQRPNETVRVHELAATARVSERTLRAAFREYYGVAPARYLQLRQLHQIERILRAADPEGTSVTQIMVSHGLWELGRFASRYRRLFGERPSETLRRRPKATTKSTANAN